MHHRARTGLCLGKASSHHRCITKHSRTGTRHNSDSKGNVSHGFPTCGPRQLRALTLKKELCQQQGWRVGRCSVQRVLRCENYLKAFGQGVIPRVANSRNLQTGRLTALRRWERVKSRQTSSDSAKVKTTCEDRLLPLATWLRSANRTASRGTTVNRKTLHYTCILFLSCEIPRSRIDQDKTAECAKALILEVAWPSTCSACAADS